MKKDRILLFDGLNFIYKANIKFKSNGKNQDYIIVYNFFRNLKSIVEGFNPTKIFFCLEGLNNFRYEINSDYKSNRKIIKTSSKGNNFNFQRDIIINLISFLPITKIYADKYEADDIIGYLVENLKNENTICISNDKDYIQLLQKDYKYFQLYDPFKKAFVKAPDYHFITYLCLDGDKSDNIKRLIKNEEAIKLAINPKELLKFLYDDKNKSNYIENKNLIEFKKIPDEEIIIEEYNLDFYFLKKEFTKMEFNSIINDKYWNIFCNTFKNIK